MTITRQSSQRGIALIVVMMAVFVLSVLAGAFAYSMKVETRLAVNSNNQVDLEWIGRSGVEYARWILGQEKCPYDSLNQKWAGGPGAACETNGPLAEVTLTDFHIGDGVFSIKITDLERKINVNTADEATLNQVLRVVGADANESGGIVDGILDWVDRDDNSRANGAETDYYQGLTPPYVSKNGPIDDISELLLIKGIRDNPEIYSKDYANIQRVDRFGNAVPPQQYAAYLSDVLTPISTGRININTADATVLQMIPGIDEAIAAQIIRVRSGPDGADGTDDDTPFASVGELASVGLPQSASPQLNHYCTTRSSTFEVEVDAQIGSTKKTYHAIIGRNNQRDIQILSFYPK
ncbi:MAG TPA: general secretion pathway protein GspK [Verrucomicrobiae bacterium]|jgi:general secretion pathway protein K|nr:general secretion pathway protein GspK [Verrucomicrobiae bacterium]